ncbi:transcriptional regulator [Methanomicrobiaceae archaeon CYW5]|uniref:ATP-binding protein n=1 Tax=Methanovulcanius yangii TaxID=1789227 RepID=UPI0029CA9D37|nr:ATP-binding protein [Methanovulcanius yangii]MBT8508714.1 transcriptional regulator [Methanovulcanius yangii]
MSGTHEEEYLVGLVQELRKLPKETEWAEFKVNNTDPEEIGEYISALANSAALSGKSHAYLVWGIEDGTHAIVGTHFSPHTAKVHGEELENYLLRSLSPKINFHFFEVTVEGHPVVLLEIERASRHPVRYKIHEFIRVGSYKKKLKDFPEKERELWRIFDQTPFEEMIAKERVSDDEVLKLLDYPAYFDLMKLPLPESRKGIIEALADDELIQPAEAGGWDITNLGAILFARRLGAFRTLRRKAIRIIIYRGNSRFETIKEQVIDKGYASGFGDLIVSINSFLPSNEEIKNALRKTVPRYPELAVRELVVNALIHQDFFLTGTGPMVEIFDDRMEISNPGIPLVATERFLDTSPKSRNETLASLMRRMGICEERGSGIDKVVLETEFYQLPAPIFEVTGETTRTVLFSPRPLTRMDKADRVRACYLHACLKYVNREYLTNRSLRKRFGIAPKNSAIVSRYIKEAIDMGEILPYDPTAGSKIMKYVPWWAAPDTEDA